MYGKETRQQEQYLKIFRAGKESFPYFCRHSVQIIDKRGLQIPLILNDAQLRVHEELRKQFDNKRKIRAVICKARQQGISTYVPPRFLSRILHHGGVRAFCLTDHSDHSQNVFNIFSRALKGLPLYRPTLEKATSDQFVFKDLNSSYSVGTARSDNVGRSSTVQLFHGSEVAFYPKSEEHMAGITQAVPHAEGTEIILESTANGIGNVFYRLCMEGTDPRSEWKTIFIPWFLTKEYAIPLEYELTLDAEELDMVDRYSLSPEQIYWRRIKINEVGDPRRFRQEYPTTLEEAFLQDADDSFITSVEISKANTPDDPLITDKDAPVIMGVDPAWRGKDDAAFCVRVGRIVIRCETFPKIDDAMRLVDAITHAIKFHKPDRVFIDVGGPGGPIYDRIKEQGYPIVQAVNFGETAEDPEKYFNKRAEMYDRLKRWLNSPPCQIPNSERLRMELAVTKWPKDSDRKKLCLAPKKDLAYSPNLADAMALTFASSVPNTYLKSHYNNPIISNSTWNPYGAFRH